MNNVIGIKGGKEAPRDRRSSMETMIISVAMVDQWVLPPFQRPLRVNEKIKVLAEEIKADGVSIPGVITLGKLGTRSNALYLVDGQHRMQAFRMSDLQEAIADVRIVQFDTMAEMAQAFVDLNSSLVTMKPDDILRGLEPTSKALQRIRSECAYVTYGQLRRGDPRSPVLGMSQTVRAWQGSQGETPSGNSSGRTAVMLVEEMDDDSVSQLVRFLHLAYAAWGSDKDYYRLWGLLNLTMCMWLFRRLVLDRTRGVKRYVTLTDVQFKQCLMALSADGNYVDFLHRRAMGDRDRAPTYSHIRRIFTGRLKSEGNPKPLMPQPAWAK
jgi:hypothetical protein